MIFCEIIKEYSKIKSLIISINRERIRKKITNLLPRKKKNGIQSPDFISQFCCNKNFAKIVSQSNNFCQQKSSFIGKEFYIFIASLVAIIQKKR